MTNAPATHVPRITALHVSRLGQEEERACGHRCRSLREPGGGYGGATVVVESTRKLCVFQARGRCR